MYLHTQMTTVEAQFQESERGQHTRIFIYTHIQTSMNVYTYLNIYLNIQMTAVEAQFQGSERGRHTSDEMLRHAQVCGNTLQQTGTHYKTLQNTATHTSEDVAARAGVWQPTATHCKHCKTLQHTARRCNTYV